ncbi:MAG: class I SAM-dependent methyltransferase [SAR202 cluster bacterium]|nr:class I SAM-dependent methyltransferase [SAR202 cluster bacterium]
MREYEPSSYGERNADVYDEMYESMQDVGPVVDLLAELAKGGRALELGIGTGRIAIPLSKRGVKVEGIDGSEKMVDRMRQKPGGERIPVAIGDFAEVGVKGKFSLVYIPFNTIYNLVTQEAQVRCFQNVAKHLKPGGAFLIEAFVPDMARFTRGQQLEAYTVRPDLVVLDAGRLHPTDPQRVQYQNVHISNNSVRLYPVELRLAPPAEMDLMAQLAGLKLKDRWSGWGKEPFTTASTTHVSVYVWS